MKVKNKRETKRNNTLKKSRLSASKAVPQPSLLSFFKSKGRAESISNNDQSATLSNRTTNRHSASSTAPADQAVYDQPIIVFDEPDHSETETEDVGEENTIEVEGNMSMDIEEKRCRDDGDVHKKSSGEKRGVKKRMIQVDDSSSPVSSQQVNRTGPMSRTRLLLLRNNKQGEGQSRNENEAVDDRRESNSGLSFPQQKGVDSITNHDNRLRHSCEKEVVREYTGTALEKNPCSKEAVVKYMTQLISYMVEFSNKPIKLETMKRRFPSLFPGFLFSRFKVSDSTWLASKDEVLVSMKRILVQCMNINVIETVKTQARPIFFRELSAILRGLGPTFAAKELRIFILLSFETMLRNNDMTQLCWQNIIFNPNGKVKIEATTNKNKMGEKVIADLNDETVGYLKEWRELSLKQLLPGADFASTLVFKGSPKCEAAQGTDGHIHTSNKLWSARIRTAAETMGYPPACFTAHSLTRGKCTIEVLKAMLNEGVNESDAIQLVQLRTSRWRVNSNATLEYVERRVITEAMRKAKEMNITSKSDDAFEKVWNEIEKDIHPFQLGTETRKSSTVTEEHDILKLTNFVKNIHNSFITSKVTNHSAFPLPLAKVIAANILSSSSSVAFFNYVHEDIEDRKKLISFYKAQLSKGTSAGRNLENLIARDMIYLVLSDIVRLSKSGQPRVIFPSDDNSSILSYLRITPLHCMENENVVCGRYTEIPTQKIRMAKLEEVINRSNGVTDLDLIVNYYESRSIMLTHRVKFVNKDGSIFKEICPPRYISSLSLVHEKERAGHFSSEYEEIDIEENASDFLSIATVNTGIRVADSNADVIDLVDKAQENPSKSSLSDVISKEKEISKNKKPKRKKPKGKEVTRAMPGPARLTRFDIIISGKSAQKRAKPGQVKWTETEVESLITLKRSGHSYSEILKKGIQQGTLNESRKQTALRSKWEQLKKLNPGHSVFEV